MRFNLVRFFWSGLCVVISEMVHITTKSDEDREKDAERRMRENLQRFLSQQRDQQQQQRQQQQPRQQQQQHGLNVVLNEPQPNQRRRVIMGTVTGRSLTFKCNNLTDVIVVVV